MTATTSVPVKDQELFSFGLVESASVNSIADFIPSISNEIEENTERKNQDFVNIFICHLIFYSFFCLSLVLYILIDLGLGSFIKKQSVYFTGLLRKTVVAKNPAFA